MLLWCWKTERNFVNECCCCSPCLWVELKNPAELQSCEDESVDSCCFFFPCFFFLGFNHIVFVSRGRMVWSFLSLTHLGRSHLKVGESNAQHRWITCRSWDKPAWEKQKESASASAFASAFLLMWKVFSQCLRQISWAKVLASFHCLWRYDESGEVEDDVNSLTCMKKTYNYTIKCIPQMFHLCSTLLSFFHGRGWK